MSAQLSLDHAVVDHIHDHMRGPHRPERLFRSLVYRLADGYPLVVTGSLDRPRIEIEKRDGWREVPYYLYQRLLEGELIVFDRYDARLRGRVFKATWRAKAITSSERQHGR